MPPPVVTNSAQYRAYYKSQALLFNEPHSLGLPAKVLAAIAYYHAILTSGYGNYNAIEAHHLTLEFQDTGGQGMTREEMHAVQLWGENKYPSGDFIPSEVGIGAGILQLIGYSVRRFFKDVFYLWKMRPTDNSVALDESVARKRKQRKLRLGISVGAFVLGALLSLSSVAVFTYLVSFIEILLLGILASVGISIAFLPPVLLVAIGGFALAFMVNYITHHAIRLYNYLNYGDTNPILNDRTIEKRTTWHTKAKIVGAILGVLTYGAYVSMAGIVATSALAVIIPAAYLGYVIVNSIFNDLASYQHYKPRYFYALFKISSMTLIAGMILFAFHPLVLLGAGLVAIGAFAKIVFDHYQQIVNQNKNSKTSLPAANVSDDIIEQQSAVHQKAKFKLERDNLVSALIDWPAKILAEHIYRISLAQGDKKAVAIIGLIILPILEMAADICLTLLVRPIQRIWRLVTNSTGFYNGFQNFLQIFNFTQGTAYEKKYSQNNWKSKQAKEMIEYVKIDNAAKITENKQSWTAVYSQKAKLQISNGGITDWYNHQVLGMTDKTSEKTASKSNQYLAKESLYKN